MLITEAHIFTRSSLSRIATMSDTKKETWKAHWRLFVACGIIILSPFQYGFDFGMIGGLQAMKGFLQVRRHYISWKSLPKLTYD